MFEKNKIFDLANFTLGLAEKKSLKIKGAEVYFSVNKYLDLEIEENSIKNSVMGRDFGTCLRVIDNRGSLGFAFTNLIDKNSLEKLVSQSIKMMRAGTPDPDFKNLPPAMDHYPDIKDLYDNNLEDIRIEDGIKYVEDMIKICEKDEKAISQSAEFSVDFIEEYIFNSNGIEAYGKETNVSVSSNIIARDPVSKETSFGYDWQSERKLKDIEPLNVAQSALKKAKGNLNRIKITNMQVPLILTPIGTINLILRPIASAVNGETFQYKRSFLVGKRGKKVGIDKLSISDNALIDGAVGSSIFDAEGVPGQSKKIIKDGKFLEEGLLHNSYTAHKAGVKSTGNASRRSYKGVPSISSTNFLMETGDHHQEEIIEGVKKGILMDITGDSPNITTGDFSGLILQGNLIENGEVGKPLNETMLGINLLDLFQNIEAISKNQKVYGKFFAPWVRVKDVQIIGSK
ncbi:MAG: TldD/PmbA family protein [Promethearchaeia archaeon]